MIWFPQCAKRARSRHFTVGDESPASAIAQKAGDKPRAVGVWAHHRAFLRHGRSSCDFVDIEHKLAPGAVKKKASYRCLQSVSVRNFVMGTRSIDRARPTSHWLRPVPCPQSRTLAPDILALALSRQRRSGFVTPVSGGSRRAWLGRARGSRDRVVSGPGESVVIAS
jgi:hypothetical protein